MLDIKLIRENPSLVRKNLARRKNPKFLKDLDLLIAFDKKYRDDLFSLEQLRKKRNEVSEKVAGLKRQEKPFNKEIEEMRSLSKKIPEAEAGVEDLQDKIHSLLLTLPNLLHDSVPEGRDESESKVMKAIGKPPRLKNPKNHVQILAGMGLLDSERAAKVSSHGFHYLKGHLALLDYALIRYAIEFMIGKGFTLIEPPFMLRRKPYEGVTSLEDFENVMYKMEGEDLYLIATSEHSMAAMHMDEVLDARDLPVKLVGISPCFRREVGSHGKYTKGLFRMHHFNKVEQFIFCLPEDSWKLHEELQRNAEQLYKKLGLAFRVVNVCTGDVGILAAKKYDIEAWMADGEYREVVSNSNCTDYQARRLKIRYRKGEGLPPKGFVHTLNSTAIATSRTMIAIIEQFQRPDGTVKIPKILQPYMNGVKLLEPL